MVEQSSVCLKKIAQAFRPLSRAFSLTLKNTKVSVPLLKKNITSKVQESAEACEHVLAIQDWTELNHASNFGKNKLNSIGSHGKIGHYQLHPMLAFDASSSDCLGVAAINHRFQFGKKSKAEKKAYTKLPIEKKRTFAWIENAIQAKANLKKAKMITVIGDREEDFYMAFVRIPDEKTHLLARVDANRCLSNGEKLHPWMDSLEVRGSYKFKVSARKENKKKKQKKRTAREATMEVSFSEVEIVKPQSLVDKDAPETIKVRVVNVKESAKSVPEGEEAVHWRLITTHSIENFDKAMKIIGWYGMRWDIEQIFRTMKKKGLDIESSQIEDKESLLKLAMITLQATVTVMQLIKARDGNARRPATDVFEKEEIKALEAVAKKVEGKTAKQKNSFKKHSLSWAAWIIARLGGWDVYCSSPPGPITMSRGLDEFYSIFRGWLIAKDMVPE